MSDQRTITYCVVAGDLAEELHEPLRRHWREDPSIEVIVERRASDRRRFDRRRRDAGPPTEGDRRAVRNPTGRRVRSRKRPAGHMGGVTFSSSPMSPRRRATRARLRSRPWPWRRCRRSTPSSRPSERSMEGLRMRGLRHSRPRPVTQRSSRKRTCRKACIPRRPLNENRPHFQRAASDPGLAQSGRAGVRARKGRLDWLGRREAPMSAASPEPMSRRLGDAQPRGQQSFRLGAK